MKRASYREAIEWIARNDDVDTLDEEAVSSYLTTGLVADLFGKEQSEVARAVVRFRLAHRDAM